MTKNNESKDAAFLRRHLLFLFSPVIVSVLLESLNFALRGQFIGAPDFTDSIIIDTKGQGGKRKMNKSIKPGTQKVFSILLVFCILFSMLPTVAFAASCTVSYDANAGEGVEVTGVPEAVTAETGSEFTLSTAVPARSDGYLFGGWSLTADGTDVVSSITPDGDTTVYAIWVPSCTVTYDDNGKDGSVSGMPESASPSGYAAAADVSAPVVLASVESVSFAGGDGISAETAYEIATAEQLLYLPIFAQSAAGNGAYYKLTADIDLEGCEWTPIGTGAWRFGGNFDGQDHIISNLTITDTSAQYQGFFGYTAGAVIQNVRLKDVSITAGTYSGGLVGYLAATSNGPTTVSHCSVTGSVSATGNYAGGVAAYFAPYSANVSKISDCFTDVDVTAAKYAGGFIGRIGTGTGSGVWDSYSYGTVAATGTGSLYSSGFTYPSSSTTISNCYYSAAQNPSFMGFYNTSVDDPSRIQPLTSLPLKEIVWKLNSSAGAKTNSRTWATGGSVPVFADGDNTGDIVYRVQAVSNTVLTNLYVTGGEETDDAWYVKPDEEVSFSVRESDYGKVTGVSVGEEAFTPVDNIYTYTLPTDTAADVSVNASFVLDAKTITYAGNNCTIGTSAINGTASTNTSAYEGDRVTVTVSPEDGYVVTGLSYTPTGSEASVKISYAEQENGTFAGALQMPEMDIAVTAVLEKVHEVSGSQATLTGNGTVSLSTMDYSGAAVAVDFDPSAEGSQQVRSITGETVTLHIAPRDSAYVLKSLSVVGVSGDIPLTTVTKGSVYTFVMPDEDVTLSAEFTFLWGHAGTESGAYVVNTVDELALLADTIGDAPRDITGMQITVEDDILEAGQQIAQDVTLTGAGSIAFGKGVRFGALTVSGGAAVSVNGDLSGALVVTDSTVDLTGNITAATTTSPILPITCTNSAVTVAGKVTSTSTSSFGTVLATGSTVTISAPESGDGVAVENTSRETYYYSGVRGVNSVITINGDVISHNGAAVYANPYSEITVNGDITYAGNGTGTYGIYLFGGSAIVHGNILPDREKILNKGIAVYGCNNGYDYDYSIFVDGNAEGFGTGPAAVSAGDGLCVIRGYAAGGTNANGVEASNGSAVITGDVTGGLNGVTVKTNIIASPYTMYQTIGTVTVGGNVIGSNGYGATVGDGSALYYGGTVSGTSGGLDVAASGVTKQIAPGLPGATDHIISAVSPVRYLSETVSQGAGESELNMIPSLNALVDWEKFQRINLTWSCDGGFDGNVPGNYTFSAQPSANYMAGGFCQIPGYTATVEADDGFASIEVTTANGTLPGVVQADVSSLGYGNASLIKISGKNTATAATVCDGKIGFYAPYAGTYYLSDLDMTVSQANVAGNLESTTLGYFHTSSQRYIMGNFAGLPAAGSDVFQTTWKAMNVYAGYDKGGTLTERGVPVNILLEDRDEITGRLIGSLSIDGSQWSVCPDPMKGPYYLNYQLDPSEADYMSGYGLGNHTLYAGDASAEKLASAKLLLNSVRDGANTALFAQYRLREYSGPIVWKIDVSSKFSPGDAVRLDYLLGAANSVVYHSAPALDYAALEDDYAPLYGATYVVDSDGYLTFTLYNGGFFSLTKTNAVQKDITGFSALSAVIASQHVANGTSASSLTLPDTLGATVDGVDGTVINGVTWTCVSYSATTAGTYTFTAVLPEGYILDNVNLPTITVTVAAGSGTPTLPETDATLNDQILNDVSVFYAGSGTSAKPYLYLVDGTNTGNSDTTNDVKVSWKHLNRIAGYGDDGTGTAKLKTSSGILINSSDGTGVNAVAETYEYREGNAVDGDIIWAWTFDGKNRDPILDAYKHPADLNVDVKKESGIVYANFACGVDLWGTASVKLYVGDYFKDGEKVTLTYKSGCGDNDQMHGTWRYTNETWDTVIKDVAVDDGYITFDITHGGKFSLTSSSGENAATSGGAAATGNITAKLSLTASIDNSGKAAISVSQSDLKGLIDEAVNSASAADASPSIELNIAVGDGAKALEAGIPGAAMSSMVTSGIRALTVSSAIASVTLDADTVKGIAESAGDSDVVLTASQVDPSSLPEKAKAMIAGHPVFNFAVHVGGKEISSFDGSVMVSVPYSPLTEEDINAVLIFCIAADGAPTPLKNSIYDPDTKTITFRTTHFSNYAVGYNKVGFTDVSGWYSDYVTLLAARDIINGKGGSRFEPEASITRGEFALILARLSGADLSVYDSASFRDVKPGDWYFGAVQWAFENGVITGSDGEFAPEAVIVRQDMAVMLTRYLSKVAKTSLSQASSAKTFTDGAAIADYAKDAVTDMQKAGILCGRPDGSFAPAGTATRAEAAKMIALVMQEMF